VARLATVGTGGRPHVVPICFALFGDTLYFAVDSKPKRTRDLQRIRNLAARPAVAILVDHYSDDWSELWWVRADGIAHVVGDPVEADRAIGLLIARYPAYTLARPAGPVVAVAIERLSGWSA
jgi:PPOX class probable F420-dependent enzyme